MAVRAMPRFGPADNKPQFTYVLIRRVLRLLAIVRRQPFAYADQTDLRAALSPTAYTLHHASEATAHVCLCSWHVTTSHGC